MIIDKLDKCRILVALKEDDMTGYDISVDKLNLKDEKCRASLKKLIKSACENQGVKLNSKAVLIEVMPHKDGLLILITLDFVRKTYKVKKPKMMPACRFSDAESLLACASKLKSEKAAVSANSLWLYAGKYYLLLEFPRLSPKAKAVLSEFGACISMSKVMVSRIKEAGREISGSNAVDKIVKSIES